MEIDERSDVLQLLENLSADDKIQLISFLRGLRGNECNSTLPAFSQVEG